MSLIICFEYRFREPMQKSLQRYTFLIIYANFFTKKHPLFTKMQYNPIENASDPRKTRERPAKMDPPLPSLQDHPKNQRFFGDPGREGAYPAGDISRRERGGRAREEAQMFHF